MSEELNDEEAIAIADLDARRDVGDEGFNEQMMRDVTFSPEDIDTAMIDQAGLFAFYADQSRIASKRADNLKLKLSIVEAEVDKEIRDQVAADGKKITEKAIDKEILRHVKYIKAAMAYNDAKSVAQMIRDVLESFKQRKDMLIQIGVAKREERQGVTRVVTSEQAAVNMEEKRAKFKKAS